MRLSLGLLEDVRRDPSSLAGGVPHFVGRMTRRRILEMAIRRYHKRGETIESALDHLRAAFGRHFDSTDQLHELEDQFIAYATTYQGEGFVTIHTFHRAAIPVGSGVVLTGEVPRIDYGRDDGYAIWLFQYHARRWRDELRMPLLQSHIASRFGVPPGIVTVGIYDLVHTAYEATCFSTEVLSSAENEVRQLAGSIHDILGLEE